MLIQKFSQIEVSWRERFFFLDNKIARIVIVFKFKANYPDEIPAWEIEEAANVDSEYDVDEFLTKQVETAKQIVFLIC